MSTATHPIKSTQIVAGVAVVIALLGGAYAVGRSQGGEPVPDAAAPMPAATSQPATNAAREAAVQPQVEPAPARIASRGPATTSNSRPPAATVAQNGEPLPVEPALCSGCARVTDVHTEARRGQSSGVGAVGGAVVGGLLGNMVGGGNGRKLATVAGAVGGGYAGNEIEKNQKSHTVWVIQVREADGRTRRFERSADPGLRVGDVVRLTEGGFSRV
ncbi:glycine zipper 2TM domain-containing protein [Pelomonas baiyunensis]|uniref:Glycine zipper 2TM domain-containing protein n=1 Tax=Pelomonas baiyunensis TaxID=3299026 RepID=A0ABW7H141_9BURK